jgi:hypothetical protein
MAHSAGKGGGPKRTPAGYGYERANGKPELHVTAGGVLTPVRGFSGPGVTGTPPAPQHRGFPKEPGDGNIPGGKSRKAGGDNALKSFGLNTSGKNDQ